MASSTNRLEGRPQSTMSPSIAPRPKDGEAVPAFPRLSTSNSTTLHRLYVANKAELTRHVGAAAGAQEYLWGGDDWFIRWHEAGPLVVDDRYNRNDSEDDIPGFDADSHNLIEHQVLPWPVINSAVDMIISRFEGQRRRFSWVVGPMDQPQLETALRNRDLFLEEDEPAMVADLDNCAPLDVKVETLPLSPQDAARFRLRDYQMQLMRLEQLNRRRLMLVRELEAKSQQDPPGISGEHGGPAEQQQIYPSDEQLQRSSRSRQAPTHAEAAGKPRDPVHLQSLQPVSAEATKPLRNGYEIKPITDAAGVANWVRAWAYEAKSPRAAGVRHWVHIYTTLFARLPSTQFQMFAAVRPSSSPPPPPLPPSSSSSSSSFSSSSSSSTSPTSRKATNSNNNSKKPMPPRREQPEDNPVLGTGFVHMYDGAAAIHCVVVRPEFRGRGIGRELARHGMRTARDSGYRLAMLTGTPLALGVFRALGFENIGRVKMYVWRPLRDGPVVAAAPPGPEDKTAEAERDGWEWVE